MILPRRFNFFLGCFLGNCGFIILSKKRRLSIKNLKRVFPSCRYEQLEGISRRSFVALALNIIEALYIPKIDSKYINKYVAIENLEYLDQALAQGKGAIFLAYHYGNWELANIACALQGYVYKVVVNEQRYPLLNNLLNRYRESRGAKTIPRGLALRQILKALKNNEVVALVGDQGGKDGGPASFFGADASMPLGAIKFAMATGASIIPVFIRRERRFSHKIVLEEPLYWENLQNSESEEQIIEEYLRKSSAILERQISAYPQEYFWFYKIWKYSSVRTAVILSDGKAGHLRQCETVMKVMQGVKREIRNEIIEVKFKGRLAKRLYHVGLFVGFNLVKLCVRNETYTALKLAYVDLVVSGGSALAGINLFLAKENLAKSVCVMKPGLLSVSKFNLVILPGHDRFARKKNTVVTSGALNLVDDKIIQEQSVALKNHIGRDVPGASLGLLIGGDTRRYSLSPEVMRDVLKSVKNSADNFNKNILVATSRRTSPECVALVKEELSNFSRCPFLVIANEKNVSFAVGGILGLAEVVIVSGESISMVSEAASSGKYVVAFRLKSRALGKTRHEIFLENLERDGYIYIADTYNLENKITEILIHHPPIKKLDDSAKIKGAIEKLL